MLSYTEFCALSSGHGSRGLVFQGGSSKVDFLFRGGVNNPRKKIVFTSQKRLVTVCAPNDRLNPTKCRLNPLPESNRDPPAQPPFLSLRLWAITHFLKKFETLAKSFVFLKHGFGCRARVGRAELSLRLPARIVCALSNGHVPRNAVRFPFLRLLEPLRSREGWGQSH